MKKRPTNFDKIDGITLYEDSIQYGINIGTDGVWINPMNPYLNKFENVILLDMKWNESLQQRMSVDIHFCTLGTGNRILMTIPHPISLFHLKTIDNFIEWCRTLVRKYQKYLKNEL